MVDYVKELEDTVWCNDRSIVDGVFDARTRLENGKPTLECKNKDDSFTVFSDSGNKKLTYPTAIINADELTYAGEVLKKTQTDTFVNIAYSYWSMTQQLKICILILKECLICILSHIQQE